MAVTQSISTGSGTTETPYKLDPDQTLRASRTLLTHMKAESQKLIQKSAKKNLLASEGSDDEEVADGDAQPVWLNLATKQHIVDKNKLKPNKIKVPHSLNTAEDISICLITTDPQRAVKNVIADDTFPAPLAGKIAKIIGVSKLAARYKTFESLRQLHSEYDIFLADDRIVTRLPNLLKSTFYKGTTKRPIPISIAPRKTKDESNPKRSSKKKGEEKEAAVASPAVVAAEIERALDCVPVSLKPGLNVSVKVGLESFTPDQLSANIEAVVPALIEKHVVKQWRNVRSINIKSPTSFPIPIWLSDDLGVGAENSIKPDEDESKLLDDGRSDDKKRKRNPTTSKGPQAGTRKKTKVEAEKVASDRRKERLSTQKTKAFSSES